MSQAELTLSIVSHGHISLVTKLLQDLAKNCVQTVSQVILTLNIPEDVPDWLGQLPFAVHVVRNESPLGYGENNNRAFGRVQTMYFCVVNPDIRISANIFPALIEGLIDKTCGVIAPLIVNAEGVPEDSARKFPTPLTILCKFFGGCKGQDYRINGALLEPDWVGGMFMLFRTKTFASLGGFDERFFLYYEDVNLCARIRLMGWRVVLDPSVRAIHLARRSSHRNSAYSLMHIRSMLRFFTSITFLRVLLRRLK